MNRRSRPRGARWVVGFVFVVLWATGCSERPEETVLVVPSASGTPVSSPEVVVMDDPRVPDATTLAVVPIFEDFRGATFSQPTVIDNRWFPLTPGTRAVFAGTSIENGEKLRHRIEHIVTNLTKEISGVETVAVWVEDYSDDELVEAELAFYAQDDDGNVWFFGEHPEEYEEEVMLAAPTWIAGIDDARTGIAMYAEPSPDLPPYFQGWGPSVDWSDFALVDSVEGEDCVAVGCFGDVITIAESSLEERGAYQLKSYAPGVGLVRVDFTGDDLNQELLELASYETISQVEMERYEALSRAMESHAYAISPAVYGVTPRLKAGRAG